jgi:LysM repeat protein
MTVTGEPPSSLPAEGDVATRPSRRRDGLAVREVCPYLVADEGTWRSAYAAREHRCGAVTPPAPLAVAKQRQLCLLAAHEGCATYLAARAVADDAAPLAPGDDGAALWQASTAPPLVLEPARRMGALPTATARTGGSALVIGLMVVAFLVLVMSRLQSPSAASDESGASPAPSLSALVAATSTPEPSPSPTPTDTPTASDEPSLEGNVAATGDPETPAADPATPEPTRYKVKSGDTLSSIAARYGVTVKRLQAANDISNPRALKIGQVLVIP